MDPITIQKMNQYGISFVKKTNGTKLVNGNDYLAGYISSWAYFATPEDIEDFILDINRCINGSYDYGNEDATMYSIHTFHTELTPQGLIIYNKDSSNVVISTSTFPFQDLKVLLLAVKDFISNG